MVVATGTSQSGAHEGFWDLLQIGSRYGLMSRKGAFVLRGDAECGVNELTLPYNITFCQPPDLPFTNHMHRLVTFNCPQRPFHRSKPETGGDAFLDESMIP